MAKTSARDRRAAAREQRRGAAADDPEVAEAIESVDGDPGDALRAAASAAIAGAAVGAARAFARRRHPEEEQEHDTGDDDEESLEPPADEAPEPDDEPEREPEPEPEPRPVAAGDARRIVQRAREQLSELHGAEAESVSAVRRTPDGWRVGLEVVEVHRIPESTDVLATYEVEVDDDGQLLTFERTRRYYRSEADRR
jgi:hypothetical protein